MVDEGRSSVGAPATRMGTLRGLGYVLRGFRYVYAEHPGLFRYWLPPILLTLLSLGALAYMVLDLRSGLLDGVWLAPQGDGLLDGIVRAGRAVLQWALAALLFALGVVVVALLTNLLAAPFNDALSQRVERLYLGKEPPTTGLSSVLTDAGRTLALEARKLALYAVIMLPLLALSLLLPVVGPALYSAAGFGFTVFFLAGDYVDWPAGRAGLTPRGRLRFASRHLRAMFGFGAGVWVLLFVPLLNLLFMPAAVAGGTLLFHDLRAQDELSQDS